MLLFERIDASEYCGVIDVKSSSRAGKSFVLGNGED